MDKKSIVIKVMGFENDDSMKGHIITIPSSRFEQLRENDMFYEYISKKVMGYVYEEAVRLSEKKYLSIEEVLDFLGYNDSTCEDKIEIDIKKLKEYVDKQ